jgi:segregation and condensation protein B
MARTRSSPGELDTELEDLPAPARWREWMGRVEAAIFASAAPTSRETLTRVVGKTCNLELIIDDIRDELRDRPYEIVSVAGGCHHAGVPCALRVRQPSRLAGDRDA